MSIFFRNKIAKNDFKEDNLPSNRKEVFIDCLKLRLFDFFKIGLLIFLFALPLLIAGLVKDTLLFNLLDSLNGGQISEEDFNDAYTLLLLGYYLVEIVCLIIFSLGLAGSLRVIRQIAWGEAVFFIQDFFEGIKLNIKHFIIYFLFIGTFIFLNHLVMIFDIQYEIIKAIPFGISVFVLFPPLLYSLAETLMYTNGVIAEYKNGFALYIKTFPGTILATSIILLPLLFELISLFIVKYIVISVFIILFFPIILLGEFLFFNSRLDKYVNKESYPEIYDKGIHRKNR